MISGPGYNSKWTLEEEWATENPRVVAGETDPIGEGRAIQGRPNLRLDKPVSSPEESRMS